MKAVYILSGVFLVLFLISRIRVGVWLEFGESGLSVKLRLAGFYIRLFPAKKKKKKEKTPGKEKEKTEGKTPKGISLALVKEVLPVVADAAGQLKRRIQIDKFQMDLIWGAADPAACAMGFGAVNAAAGMIWPLVEQNFNVKDHRVRTAVDFEQGSPSVYILAMITMTIAQGISWVLRVCTRFLKAYLKLKPPKEKQTNTEQKEAV